MSRKGKISKRKAVPDLKFHDILVTKFVNDLMRRGGKSVAEGIFYDCLDFIAKKTGNKNPLEVLKKAIDNTKPILEVKPRRVGGATYQVPVEVSPERRVNLAIKWIVGFSRAKTGKPMSEKLALELLDAFNNTGVSVKKKEDTHKMAEANKAFAHYRW